MIKKKVKSKAEKVSKVQKRSNPYFTHEVKEILKNLDSTIKFKFVGEGQFGETYHFKTNHNILYRNIILKPNEYILKLFTKGTSLLEINWLKKLSAYGLIPKIYYINDYFIIMKYIEGQSLLEYDNKHGPLNDKILNRIKYLVNKWHGLGFAHGDLNENNILITKNEKVYFIDPYFPNSQEFDYDLDRVDFYFKEYS
jgi:RIO-like serine/threonine protein kinase